jgi:hypothetical protein
MEKDEPPIPSETKKPTRFDMPIMSARIAAPYDVRSPDMIQYMLTEDKLDSLEGGAEALEFTFFGAFLAAPLTLVSLGVPLCFSNQQGRVFFACVILSPVFLLASVYFSVKGLAIRRGVKKKIKQIKDESKTVLEMVAKPPEGP